MWMCVAEVILVRESTVCLGSLAGLMCHIRASHVFPLHALRSSSVLFLHGAYLHAFRLSQTRPSDLCVFRINFETMDAFHTAFYTMTIGGNATQA
jgi:hypothetical protein